MDWARGIVVSEGKLEAEVVSSNGATSILGLAELYRRGLPTANKAVRRQMTVDFAGFNPCDAKEYATHVGLVPPDGTIGKHQVFEVLSDGQRFLVPALALMRALFRPASKLLARMFAPSALERNCWLDHSGGEPRIVVDVKWAQSWMEERNSDWSVPLTWMTMYPSARKMADSVHRHAMSGALAVDLPKGRAELVFAGVQAAIGVLVTEVRVLTVFPGEVSDLLGASVTTSFDFINRDWAKGRNIQQTLSAAMPLTVSSSPQVTDGEWAILGPLLEGQRKQAKPYVLCQRKLFNGVLGKLASGKAWKSCSYEVGDWRNAAFAHRTWRLRGTLDQALDVLSKMR